MDTVERNRSTSYAQFSPPAEKVYHWALGLSIAHEGWAQEKKRPRPGVRVQRDWKRPGLRAGAPPGGELWLWLWLRFLDDEGCFANGADNWVAAQVVKHVPAVFTKSLCSALFHNYEAISNRMNRWPFSFLPVKGCGRSPYPEEGGE